MTKCRLCGESNPDGSRFCSNCGARLEEKDNSALTEALENAEKEFDRDSMVSLDKSRITYVCTVCGSVNRIDQDKCSRCGKPRPRSEYVNALRRIKQGNALREEQAALTAPAVITAPEPAPVVEPEPEPAPEPAPQPQPEPVPQPAAVGNYQASAIQQPFVIVPYVNPMQPLWQYDPDQLYRYEPYTPEEIEARRAEREMAELQRKAQEAATKAQAEAAEAAETDATGEAPAASEKPKRSRAVTAVAVITLILSIAAGVVAYLGEQFVAFAAANGESFYAIASAIGTASGWALMAPIAAMIFLVIAVVLIIRSIVRIARGRARTVGWFIPLVWIVSFAVFFVGLMMEGGAFDIGDLGNVAGDVGIGGWILLAISVVTFIASCFSKKSAKAAKGGDPVK